MVVKILSKSRVVHHRCTTEHGDCAVRAHEAVTSERDEFPDGYTATRDDECLALIELAHDLAAVVAEFALGGLSGHLTEVARVAASRL